MGIKGKATTIGIRDNENYSGEEGRQGYINKWSH